MSFLHVSVNTCWFNWVVKSRGKQIFNEISVIIPYYQKEQRILQRALNSITVRSDSDHIDEIVVIDDGSPF